MARGFDSEDALRFTKTIKLDTKITYRDSGHPCFRCSGLFDFGSCPGPSQQPISFFGRSSKLRMCHQTTYTLPCEHVRTHIVYCADAPPVVSQDEIASRIFNGSSGSNSIITTSLQYTGPLGSGPPRRRRPCKNLTQQYTPYPTPPSFRGDPSTAANSPLSPKCPLPDCPFEKRNRRWNCCWCGKGWNDKGRCSCVMIIDGTEFCCEHICCEGCEAAENGDTAK